MANERESATGYTGVEIHGNRVRVRVPFGGQWVRETTNSPPTTKGLKEAARLRDEVIARDELGVLDWAEFFPDSPRAKKNYKYAPTFRDYSKKYLDHCEFVEGKSPSTLQGYSKRLKGIWVPAFGDLKIDLIKRSHINTVITKHKWKGKTMSNALSPLRGVFALAIEDEHLKTNPAVGIKAPRSQKPPPDPLSRNEMLAVLQVLPEYWKPYFQVAFGTGMRPSELIALKWSNVKLKKGTVTVSEARVLGRDKSTKTYESRTLPITPLAEQGFIDQQEISQSKSTYVFLKQHNHEPLDTEQIQRRIWDAALKKAKVKHRKSYSTRHTFATLLLMAGEPMERVSRWMGHESPVMTYRHYARWIENEDAGLSTKALRALAG